MSRLTFREASADVAWQKQLRDRHLSEGTPPVPHLDIKRAEVRRVSRHLAEQIILKYEWLGTMASTGHHYGLFFGPYCAGVCCIAFGGGTADTQTHRLFGLHTGDLGILARGACVHWAPNGANSKLVAWAARLFAKGTGAKLLIAYSDTDAGEIGTIYQACNWAYVGMTSRPGEAEIVAPNGRIFNNKKVGNEAKRRGVTYSRMRQVLLNAGWRFQASNPKHRYVCVLDKSDKALMARVERMRLPYPKRPGSIGSDAPARPGGNEGGANPTSGLQVA